MTFYDSYDLPPKERRAAVDAAVLLWLQNRYPLDGWQTSISINIDWYRDEVRAALGRLERRGLIERQPSRQYRARWEYRPTAGHLPARPPRGWRS